MHKRTLALALGFAAACGSSDSPTTSGLSGDGGLLGGGADGGGGFTGSVSDGNGLCQAFKVDSGRRSPDMLIVLDRSSSMQGTGVDRWTPSVSGIKAITAALDARVDFGLMSFPGRGGAVFGLGEACAPGTVDVPIGPSAAAQISTTLDTLELVQTTPTAASLEAARAALATTVTDADARASEQYVVLVTDGAPNCSNGGGGGPGGAPDPAAVTATVAAISALAADGVQTYVLGFGTKTDATLAAALDQMAQAGDTGDVAHRAIEDEASIVAEFQRIAGAALSCNFALAEAPEDPTFVAVTLDGTLLLLDDPNGWSISADGKELTVLGSACDMLKDPLATHVVSVEVRCTQVTIR